MDKIKSIVNKLNIEKFEHSKDASGYPFRITNILPKNKELKKLIEKPKVLSLLKSASVMMLFFLKINIFQKKGSKGNLYRTRMALSLLTIID